MTPRHQDAVDAYASRAEQVTTMLGTAVSPADPDRDIIEPWAARVRGRILDVGSGTGRWTGHLSGLGLDIEGLEPVEELIDVARRAHPGVAFRQGAIADLRGADERWAGILAWYAVIHLGPDELPEALADLRAVLEDDGELLVSFFTGPRFEAFSHPIATAYRWPMSAMAAALERSGFEVVTQHAATGAPHAFISARAVPTGS